METFILTRDIHGERIYGLNGLITSTMSYGEEVLSIAKNRSTAPAAHER